MTKELTNISKYLSFLLRHQPQSIGLNLDEKGWASIDELIAKTTDLSLSRAQLEVVVETNDKQRFIISADGQKIRANQGHSIDIDLQLEPVEPPRQLTHGTAERFWPSIAEKGLVKGQRHHVHLTQSATVAQSVGGRYGTPLLLMIDAERMYKAGFQFYRTANNVWLVDHVPSEYVRLDG